jgi:acetyl esterase/lipase
MAEALRENGVYFELHIYPVGCHGLGLATDKNDIGTWSSHAVTFLKNLEF